MRSRIMLARAVAVALGAAIVGLAVAAPSSAVAESTPVVTATPSTGLADGQEITVSAEGFGADQAIFAAECAALDPATIVCDATGMVQFTTDENGSGATPAVARRIFEGIDRTGRSWGTIDCTTVASGCVVVAATGEAFATTPISFG